VALVEAYARAQGLFWTPESPDPQFSQTLELDLATVKPSLAGPETPAGSGAAERHAAGVERRPEGISGRCESTQAEGGARRE
jgi:aconitate hydratase